MPKFRKKPVVIDAIQLTAENLPLLKSEYGMAQMTDYDRNHEAYTDHAKEGQSVAWMCPHQGLKYAQVRTLEGIMSGNVGDYMIRGVKGELYFCKPDIFEATYEPA